jgi:hypothetical protein
MNGGGSHNVEGDYFIQFKNERIFKEKQSVQECFKHFDTNK